MIARPHRAPTPLRSDADDARHEHRDLAALPVDDLEHELCITIVGLGLDERRDPARAWWIERLRAVRAELRSRR